METLALVSVLECGVGDNHWGWNASATYNGVGVLIMGRLKVRTENRTHKELLI